MNSILTRLTTNQLIVPPSGLKPSSETDLKSYLQSHNLPVRTLFEIARGEEAVVYRLDGEQVAKMTLLSQSHGF